MPGTLLLAKAQGEAAAAVGTDAPARSAGAWARVAWMAPPVALLIGALYGPTLADLGRQWWNDANYTHGFLVPLFSGYLVWRQRARLGALAPAGSAVVLSGVRS